MFPKSSQILALLLAIAGAVGVVACTRKDSLNTLSEEDAKEARAYFSENYQEARDKFLQTAVAEGAMIQSHRHPVSGPDGAPLYTDVVVFGSQDAKNVLFIASGTHGVEGFAGSAVQVGLLRGGFLTQVDPNVRIVLIHALNPYGFSHLRRFNEDNVDINRNFLDHEREYPSNDGYDDLAEVLAPTGKAPPSDFSLIARLLLYAATNGLGGTRSAVTQGQYKYPHGLLYGGTSESWSAKILDEIVRKHTVGADQVVYVDFHTGFGPYGALTIIPNARPGDPAYERARDWWGNSVRSPRAGESASRNLIGTLKSWLEGMVPLKSERILVSAEFGTRSPLEVLSALRAENWLHHHGGADHPGRAEIKERLLRTYYPDDDAWLAVVWMHGRAMIETALERVNEG